MGTTLSRPVNLLLGAILIPLSAGVQAAILPIDQMNITDGTLDAGKGYRQSVG